MEVKGDDRCLLLLLAILLLWARIPQWTWGSPFWLDCWPSRSWGLTDCPHSARFTDPAFFLGLGDLNLGSCLLSKPFAHWAISQTPTIHASYSAKNLVIIITLISFSASAHLHIPLRIPWPHPFSMKLGNKVNNSLNSWRILPWFSFWLLIYEWFKVSLPPESYRSDTHVQRR